MIKNIAILKRVKVFYLLIFSLFFLYSCNNSYNENDFSEIIKITVNELLIEDNLTGVQKLSLEFSPRFKHLISDKDYLRNNFIGLHPNQLDQNEISEKDIDFMLKNRKRLRKEQKKLSEYVDCTDRCISTNSYFEYNPNFFENFDSFIRITLPYISINHEFATVGYGSYSKHHFGEHCFVLHKKDNKWVIVKKI